MTGREKHPYSIWRKMQERHISFEQLSDVMAFRALVPDQDACYTSLGIIHRRWPMVPGRFKDYISTPKRNGYRSLHTSVIHTENRRIEIQLRSKEMHAQAEHGFASHWLYKQAKTVPDTQIGWIRDLVEILEHAENPEEILEHTRMAMYQDRIFAFTPKGELIQLPKGATPIDFAYAVHTSLGDQAVGAKVNGRVVPLRNAIENGDQVQILKSKAQEPQPWWLSIATTGKARAAIRRFVRHKERDELVSLGRKIYEEVSARIPNKLGKDAQKDALSRLKLPDEAALMQAIARRGVTDIQLMEALVPGSSLDAKAVALPQREAISIKGLTPGVSFDLATCCHPVPGDRIVGLRRADEAIVIHTIGCEKLADGEDADWLDIAWGDGSDGGTARISVVVRNEPGSLATVAGIFAGHKANIVNMRLEARDTSFHTYVTDIEVHGLPHLTKIIAALRAVDPVVEAGRC